MKTDADDRIAELNALAAVLAALAPHDGKGLVEYNAARTAVLVRLAALGLVPAPKDPAEPVRRVPLVALGGGLYLDPTAPAAFRSVGPGGCEVLLSDGWFARVGRSRGMIERDVEDARLTF